MSTRFNLKPQLVAKAVSMNADGYSLITNINSISGLSYAINWGAGASGNFLVEVSNDYVPADGSQALAANPGTWTSLPLSVPVSSTGAAGSAFADIQTQAAYARVHFVYTAGTGGTFSVTLAGKVQ